MTRIILRRNDHIVGNRDLSLSVINKGSLITVPMEGMTLQNTVSTNDGTLKLTTKMTACPVTNKKKHSRFFLFFPAVNRPRLRVKEAFSEVELRPISTWPTNILLKEWTRLFLKNRFCRKISKLIWQAKYLLEELWLVKVCYTPPSWLNKKLVCFEERSFHFFSASVEFLAIALSAFSERGRFSKYVDAIWPMRLQSPAASSKCTLFKHDRNPKMTVIAFCTSKSLEMSTRWKIAYF